MTIMKNTVSMCSAIHVKTPKLQHFKHDLASRMQNNLISLF